MKLFGEKLGKVQIIFLIFLGLVVLGSIAPSEEVSKVNTENLTHASMYDNRTGVSKKKSINEAQLGQDCKNIMSSSLNHPSTAKHKFLPVIQRDGDIISVYSHVKAKNSFGLETKIEYICKFQDKGNEVAFLDLIQKEAH